MTKVTREQILDALNNDRFQLFGQPKWTFGRNTCNTYEVFVDLMLSEDEEPIQPDKFIPVIESDEELTKKFGSWFLEHAFIDGARLMRELEMNLTISINLLGFQANRPEFVERLTALIEKTGIYNNNLQFELSEAQPLNATGYYNLQKIHDELGIRLVLSNFGTGYSNIDLLRKLPFDVIELSKEFTKGITEYEKELKVIIGILQMAQVLDIDVCAKGIETAEQMELLEEAGFKMGQGYLIGRPLPMDELKSFICKYADEGSCGK
ncbi:MAG: EAL domain-containing protein [Clostridiaceae bacterium]|nr:EAL domain-containing protein [Clostridiaceae bacterium]